MIFAVERHIEQILTGTKTQTRRINRGRWQVGRSYSIQKCRTCKGIEGYRIVMDEIWLDRCDYHNQWGFIPLFKLDAVAEGGYTPAEFEDLFRKLNPKWDGEKRWAFKFRCIFTLITEDEKKLYAELEKKGLSVLEIENEIRAEREVEGEML